MKLVVFSDIHGNKDILERIMAFNPDADYFLSLGDSELPLDYLLDLEIIPVKGNYPRDAGYDYEHELEVNGKKILMTHGHKYKVHRTLNKLLDRGFRGDLDIVLYGHTHVAKVDKAGKMLLMNPGSAYRSRSKVPNSYMILNIDEQGEVSYQYKLSDTNESIEI